MNRPAPHFAGLKNAGVCARNRDSARDCARAVAQVEKTPRLRPKPKRSNGFDTPAGMRSVCPSPTGALAHRPQAVNGRPMSALPHPPVPVGRGPLAALESPAEQEQREQRQEQRHGQRWAKLAGRKGRRSAGLTEGCDPARQRLRPDDPAGAVQPLLIAVHDSLLVHQPSPTAPVLDWGA